MRPAMSCQHVWGSVYHQRLLASMSLFYLSTAELPLCLFLPEFNMSVAAVSSFALFIYLFIQFWLLLLQLRFVNVLHLL